MKPRTWALAGLLWGLCATGCGDSEAGAFCCTCLCCDKTATLTRQDQSWPDCGEPCNTFCAKDLACSHAPQSAEPCEP
jgi:hypothetical protein